MSEPFLLTAIMKNIDINDRAEMRRLLAELRPDTPRHWGLMTPQQMVEHLINQVQYTNGTLTPTCDRSPEEALKRKQMMLAADVEFPKNVVLNPPTDKVIYGSIDEAIDQFMIELEKFDQYFTESGATAIHGGFGPMNHDEWLIWHGKHFAHHFEQFGLASPQPLSKGEER